MDITTWIIILKHRNGKCVIATFNRDGQRNGWFSDITSSMGEADAWTKATQWRERTNHQIITIDVDHLRFPSSSLPTLDAHPAQTHSGPDDEMLDTSS